MAENAGRSKTIAAGKAWPLFRSLAGYRPNLLPGDLIAGLTLAAIAIPEQMATARLGGFSHLKVLARHIGPNVLSQAIIYAMSDIVQDIMAIVTLGYLGLGIAPPTAEWGSMISDGQQFITTHWEQATIPGLAVVVTSLGLSWLGDGLSDLLSPDRRK